MKLINMLVILLSVYIISSCCTIIDILHLPDNKVGSQLDCSSQTRLKESILNRFKCNFTGSFERWHHIDSIAWRIDETDTTYDIMFDIGGTDNSIAITGEPPFIKVTKENCRIIYSNK